MSCSSSQVIHDEQLSCALQTERIEWTRDILTGWGVQLGFSDWQNAFVWKIDNDIQRTNGTSGWPPADSTPYEINWQPGCNLTAAVAAADTSIHVDLFAQFPASGTFVVAVDGEQMLVTGGQGTSTWTVTRGYNRTTTAAHASGHGVYGPTVTSWSECAAINLAAHPTDYPSMPGDPTRMNTLYTATAGSVTYPSYTRGSLALAAEMGVPGATSTFNWIDGQMSAAISATYHPDRKWMVK